MADTLNPIDLDILQDAIEADIRAAFPDLKTVEFYGETRSGMVLPACQLDLSEWDKYDTDPGTEQQPVMLRFEARFIIKGVSTKAAKRAIRKLAGAFTAFLYQRRWSDAARPGKTLVTGEAQLLGAYRDDFDADLDQFEVWRVEWQQHVFLGASVWDGAGAAPEHVFVGIAPDIGIPHIDDYVELT
jgi:hypothetical protein